MTITLRVIGDLPPRPCRGGGAVPRRAGGADQRKYARTGDVQVVLYRDDVIAELRVRDGCGAMRRGGRAGGAGRASPARLRERAEQPGGA